MMKRPRRDARVNLEILEGRQVLSHLLETGHAIGPVRHDPAIRAAFNIPRPKLPSIPRPKLPSIPRPKLPSIPRPKLPDLGGLGHEAAGEAGRVAFTAAAGIMEVRNSNRAPHRISTADQAVLRPHFGDLVSKVTVYYGADPLNAWGARGYTIKLGGTDASAQTYGHNIYIRSAREDLSDRGRLETLTHELVHAQQYDRYGSLSNFGYQYFKGYSKAGGSYSGNKLEREAFDRTSSLIDGIYAAYRKNQSGGSTTKPKETVETIRYTIWNDSRETVRFVMQPSGKSYSLAPGDRASFASKKVNGKAPTITVKNSGKTYNLRNGDHKFFWLSGENRIGLDLNYKT